MNYLTNTNVLILCGGLGKRFRAVMEDTPKGLAPVKGKPILEILVENLAEQGASKIILCVGYLSEQIIEHFKNYPLTNIVFSIEKTPLGTGGAIKNARNLIDSKDIVVLNGDSLCAIQYNDVGVFHHKNQSDLTIVISKTDDSADYGSIQLDETKQIISFKEKINHEGPAFINAGIYWMKSNCIDAMTDTYPISLENDFFPQIIHSKKCHGFLVDSEVLDIGTPERFHAVNKKLSNPSTT